MQIRWNTDRARPSVPQNSPTDIQSDTTLGVGEPKPLDPARGGIGPGRDRTRERLSEIIRGLNELLGEDVTEADRVKRVANLWAVGEMARRDDTVAKQLAAGNDAEQIMQGGDFTRAVEDAVMDLMERSPDANDAERLLKSGEVMRGYAWFVLKMMRSGVSLDDLRDLS